MSFRRNPSERSVVFVIYFLSCFLSHPQHGGVKSMKWCHSSQSKIVAEVQRKEVQVNQSVEKAGK